MIFDNRPRQSKNLFDKGLCVSLSNQLVMRVATGKSLHEPGGARIKPVATCVTLAAAERSLVAAVVASSNIKNKRTGASARAGQDGGRVGQDGIFVCHISWLTRMPSWCITMAARFDWPALGFNL